MLSNVIFTFETKISLHIRFIIQFIVCPIYFFAIQFIVCPIYLFHNLIYSMFNKLWNSFANCTLIYVWTNSENCPSENRPSIKIMVKQFVLKCFTNDIVSNKVTIKWVVKVHTHTCFRLYNLNLKTKLWNIAHDFKIKKKLK